MPKIKRKIIFSIEQQGGLTALFPVIEKIQKSNNFSLDIFFSNPKVYESAKGKSIVNAKLLEGSIGQIKEQCLDIKPNLIFTDTNSSELEKSIDKKFVQAAKELNIPSVSFVDARKNYKDRFKENSIPDYVLAIDQEMEDGLKKEGIGQTLIKITGSPRFDKYANFKTPDSDKNLIVFFSEPFLNGKERDVFKDFLETVEKGYPEKKIIVKFHPTREESSKYDDIIKDSKLDIKKAGEIDSEILIKKAGIFVGMTSVMLDDAALAGKKVLSYQLGGNFKEDPLMSNKYGWSVPVYKKEDLSEGTKKAVEGKIVAGSKKRSDYTENNSTQKILDLIDWVLKNHEK